MTEEAILQPLTAMDMVCGKKEGGSVSPDLCSDLSGVKEPDFLGWQIVTRVRMLCLLNSPAARENQ